MSDTDIQQIKQRPWLLWALIIAVSLHGVILSIQFGVMRLSAPALEQNINVVLLAKEEKQEAEEQVEEEIKTEPPKEPIETTEEVTPTPVPKLITKQPSENMESEPAKIVVPSGASFQTFLEQETDNHLKQNPNAASDFGQTFEPVAEQVLPDFDNGQSPGGGGNYKVRRNGVTCETLVMIPQTLDDFTNGTIATAGNCKEKPKIVLDLKK